MAIPGLVALSQLASSAQGLVEVPPVSPARVGRNALLVIFTTVTLSILFVGNICEGPPGTKLQVVPTYRDLHLAKIQHAIWKTESDKMLSENSDVYDALAGLPVGQRDDYSPSNNTFVPRPHSRWSLLNADNFYIGRSVEFMMHPETLIDALDYVTQAEVQKGYRAYLDSVSVEGELSDTAKFSSKGGGQASDATKSVEHTSDNAWYDESGNLVGNSRESHDMSSVVAQEGKGNNSIEYNLHYRFFPIMFGMCGFAYSHLPEHGVDTKGFLKAKLPWLPAYLKEVVPLIASGLLPILPPLAGSSLIPALSDIPGFSYLPAVPDLSSLISGIVPSGVAQNDGRATNGPAGASSDGSKESDTIMKQEILSNVFGVFSESMASKLGLQNVSSLLTSTLVSTKLSSSILRTLVSIIMGPSMIMKQGVQKLLASDPKPDSDSNRKSAKWASLFSEDSPTVATAKANSRNIDDKASYENIFSHTMGIYFDAKRGEHMVESVQNNIKNSERHVEANSDGSAVKGSRAISEETNSKDSGERRRAAESTETFYDPFCYRDPELGKREGPESGSHCDFFMFAVYVVSYKGANVKSVHTFIVFRGSSSIVELELDVHAAVHRQRWTSSEQILFEKDEREKKRPCSQLKWNEIGVLGAMDVNDDVDIFSEETGSIQKKGEDSQSKSDFLDGPKSDSAYDSVPHLSGVDRKFLRRGIPIDREPPCILSGFDILLNKALLNFLKLVAGRISAIEKTVNEGIDAADSIDASVNASSVDANNASDPSADATDGGNAMYSNSVSEREVVTASSMPEMRNVLQKSRHLREGISNTNEEKVDFKFLVMGHSLGGVMAEIAVVYIKGIIREANDNSSKVRPPSDSSQGEFLGGQLASGDNRRVPASSSGDSNGRNVPAERLPSNSKVVLFHFGSPTYCNFAFSKRVWTLGRQPDVGFMLYNKYDRISQFDGNIMMKVYALDRGFYDFTKWNEQRNRNGRGLEEITALQKSNSESKTVTNRSSLFYVDLSNGQDVCRGTDDATPSNEPVVEGWLSYSKTFAAHSLKNLYTFRNFLHGRCIKEQHMFGDLDLVSRTHSESEPDENTNGKKEDEHENAENTKKKQNGSLPGKDRRMAMFSTLAAINVPAYRYRRDHSKNPKVDDYASLPYTVALNAFVPEIDGGAIDVPESAGKPTDEPASPPTPRVEQSQPRVKRVQAARVSAGNADTTNTGTTNTFIETRDFVESNDPEDKARTDSELDGITDTPRDTPYLRGARDY